MALIDQIMAYEQDDLSEADTLNLFATLIKNGDAWTLQGHYGRAAKAFIDAGLLTPEGEQTDYAKDWLELVS